MTALAVIGGTVVGAAEQCLADVLVEDEKVVAVCAPGGELSRQFQERGEVYDATGRFVIPGGIDVHTHFEAEGQTVPVLETFEQGTIAAAFGGTTTVIDFASPVPGTTMLDAFERYMAKTESTCAIDYGFHMNTFGVSGLTTKEMDHLVQEGVNSFKMFMAYPNSVQSSDADIFRMMRHTATNGSLIMLHAENGTVIEALREDAVNLGRIEPLQHALTRPAALELEAVFRAIQLAKVAGVPVYIVHLSSADALTAVAAARANGQNVFAETCPQYLFLDQDDLDQADFAGSKFVCSPPLRPREHHEALWKGLAHNDLQVVATDHCPFCWEQKRVGLEDFRLIPNGVPGVEHRVELLYQGGVAEGRFPLSRWVDICATAPAKLFGLYPQKGTLSPGSDADIVVFDPTTPHVLSATTHHMAAEYSCYEGTEVSGSVEAVWVRGNPVVRGGSFVGRAGLGKFLRRTASSYLT